MSSERHSNAYRGERRGTTKPVPEADLLDLFERRRPEADAFRNRIRERIQEREAEAAGESQAPMSASPVDMDSAAQSAPSPMQRAAAFLPIPTTASKLIPVALAWPLFLLAACFGGFFLGRRSLAKRLGKTPAVQGDPLTRASRKVATYGWAGGAIQFALLGAFLSGGVWVLDAILIVMLLAMVAFVWAVTRMVEAGNASRAEVAKQASSILYGLLIGGAIWMGTALGGSELAAVQAGWIFFPLALAVVGVHWFAGSREQGVFMIGWTVFVVACLNPMGFTRSSPESLKQQLTGYTLETDELAQWEEAAAVHQALVAVGEVPPGLDRVKAKVVAATKAPDDVHPTVWTSAAAMGMIDEAGWRRLAADCAHEIDRMAEIAQGGVRGERRTGISPTGYYHYRVKALVETRDLGPDALETLAQMVLGIWPEEGKHGALSRANECIELLDYLGRQDLIEAQRAASVDLLSKHWIGRSTSFGFSRRGGFTSNPQKFQTAFDGSTLAGIELMARFGIPEGIDPFLLRGFLRQGSRRFGVSGLKESNAYLHGIERAALLRLERQVGLPPQSWLEKLVGQRIMILVLLVIALCVMAIRMTPTDPLTRAGGAQP